MYDGATFMGIQSFDECQFFEHDIAEDSNKFLKVCPEDEQCCFSLREHMSIEFWGRKFLCHMKVTCNKVKFQTFYYHRCCSSRSFCPWMLFISK